MIKYAIPFVCALGFACCQWCYAEERFSFKEEHALDPKNVRPADSVTRGSAWLSVPRARVPIGEKLMVDLRFTNTGGGGYVFNPFFRAKVPLPATIAVYDAEKNYLGSYLSAPPRSYTGVQRQDWVYMWDGAYVGTTFSLLAGHLPESQLRVASKSPLSPGKYYLQAVFNNGFVNFRSDIDLSKVEANQLGETLIKLYGSYDRSELFRSNVVEIELLAAEPEK